MLGRHAPGPCRIASLTIVKVALLPPAVTPRKTISGDFAEGSGASSLRFSYGTSATLGAGGSAGVRPNRTATRQTTFGFAGAAGVAGVVVSLPEDLLGSLEELEVFDAVEPEATR